MYHNFSIHSSVMGHLCCFQSLAIVNSAAINVGVQAALLYPGTHSFGYAPRSGIPGSYVVLFLVFWGTSMLLSIMVVLIYIPTNSGEFLCYTSSPAFVVVCAIDDSHSDWSESFWFAFPFWAQMLSISSCIYWWVVLLPYKIASSVHFPIYPFIQMVVDSLWG
jgi:hypothetical protein